MGSLPFFWQPLPLLLLLSLSLAWAQMRPATASLRPPGDPVCPESCTCQPSDQANCSALVLLAVPTGLSWRLHSLLLDRNRVRSLPPGAFQGASALLRLDLQENGLRAVHARAFWGLGTLQQLDLGSNQLEALAPGTFAPLRALRNLSLANNRLVRLEPATLGTLPLLRTLSLEDNSLDTLGPGLLATLPALRSLHLRGNPGACGCAQRSLCTWLSQHPRGPEVEGLVCEAQRSLPISPLSAFNPCAQSPTLRDLAVIYVIGPFSFLASLATCLALGSVVTACRAHRRRRAAASRLPWRPPDPKPGTPPAQAGVGNPAAAQA
ncbi:leucine-rich repeat-containing protein 26 [Echinops telfairi]|uniref:Leucine-rich repeat-containing protein 26 n=1 Tax=Echinops telfairi TaxID=9371 RepID=A0ABM0J4B8_ECHTE|nr:leucine-rich repeat-containing protein 26 [Echinops telfairi]